MPERYLKDHTGDIWKVLGGKCQYAVWYDSDLIVKTIDAEAIELIVSTRGPENHTPSTEDTRRNPDQAPAPIHISYLPFKPICGADIPNQATTQITANATCERCIQMLQAPAPSDPVDAAFFRRYMEPTDGAPMAGSLEWWRWEFAGQADVPWEAALATWQHSHDGVSTTVKELATYSAGIRRVFADALILALKGGQPK